MGLMLTIFGKDELIAKYGRLASAISELLTEVMKYEMVKLADYVRVNKLSGDPLHRRTGKLSRSITGDAASHGKYVVGVVGSKGVPYAYVHEMGGVFEIPAHMRRVGFNAREERIRLLNKAGSVRAQVKSTTRGMVRAHTATYPQRAFLHPSMEENRERIVAVLREAAVAAMHAT
jgi:phage gpG-like protein